MTTEKIHALGGLFLLLSGFVCILYYIRARHIEKLELIKKGDPLFAANYLENLKYSVLGKAILLIALAVGLGAGFGINLQIKDGNSQVAIYLICLLASGGLGLLVYYFIIQNKDK